MLFVLGSFIRHTCDYASQCLMVPLSGVCYCWDDNMYYYWAPGTRAIHKTKVNDGSRNNNNHSCFQRCLCSQNNAAFSKCSPSHFYNSSRVAWSTDNLSGHLQGHCNLFHSCINDHRSSKSNCWQGQGKALGIVTSVLPAHVIFECSTNRGSVVTWIWKVLC